MELRPILTKLNNELSQLNQSEPVIVTYNKKLEYLQMNKVLSLEYLNPYFLTKKGFKFGVLTHIGLNRLIYNVQQLLSNSDIDNGITNLSMGELSMNFYRYFGPTFDGPQLFKKLEFVNIKSGWISRIYCKFFNENTKLILKSLDISRKNSLKQKKVGK
jgi:hypothetical protein